MTLRRKTLLLVVIVFAISLAVLHLVSTQVLMEGYRRLEESDSLADVQRGVAALQFDVNEFASTALAWAHSDDFARLRDDGLFPDTFSDETLQNLRINAMLLVDADGTVAYARGFDLLDKRETEVPRALLDSLNETSPLLQHGASAAPIAGILTVADKPMLVVAIPVQRMEGDGVARDSLVWGRMLDRHELDRLSDVTQLPLILAPYSSGAFRFLNIREPFQVHQGSPEMVVSYALLRDVYGQPSWVLAVSQPRLMYQWGLISVRYFLAVLLLVALIFGIFVMVSTDRLILSRLANLTHQLLEIGQKQDLSARVAIKGKDEIGQLSGSINGLLANLERSNLERAALQQQVIQTQKTEAVGRLAGGIAHDFNNILTAVMGYTDRLSRRAELDEEGDHCVGEIDKLSHRAATLTRQLLAFGRRQVLQPKVLDLNLVMFEVQSMLRRLIGEDVELNVAPAPDLGNVKADPAQLEQVIINLALNARDAMPRGGKLVVSTQNLTVQTDQTETVRDLAPGAYVTLSMTDTGHGMTPEVKAHLFEPFFSTKGVGRGTGLGLATCYGIVKQSGGHIDVKSEVGRGTTVTIYLPHVPDTSVAETTTNDVNAVVKGGEETILVVEDESAVRQMTADALRELGYTVLEASDGLDALKVLAAEADQKIDLLVTDIVMPNMGGTELAAAFAERSPQTRILFISGYANIASSRSGVLGEHTEFLPKPFTSRILGRRVREVLDLQRTGAWHLTC